MNDSTELELPELEYSPFADSPAGGIEDLGDGLHAAWFEGRAELIDTEAHRRPHRPRQRETTVSVNNAESLVRYLVSLDGQTLGVDGKPQLWVDMSRPECPSLLAVFDPDGHRTHRARIRLTPTPEMAMLAAGDYLKQPAFADMVERWAHLFESPDSATMLELAQTFRRNTIGDAQFGHQTSSGARTLILTETVETKAGKSGEITVPTEVRLSLQPFVGGATYTVHARFRHRVNGDHIYFALLPANLDRVIAMEVDAITTDLAGHFTIIEGSL